MLSFLLALLTLFFATLLTCVLLIYRQLRVPIPAFPPPPPPDFSPASERSIRRGLSHAIPTSPTSPHPPTFDVIVIGSGLSGLTAASLLSPTHSTLLLESHSLLGGCTHTWQAPSSPPYAVGVHYCGGDLLSPYSPFRSVLDLITGGRVQWSPTFSPSPSDPSLAYVYDVVHIGPRRLLVPAGTRRWLAAAIAQFPDEAAVLRQYVALTLRINKEANFHFLLHALLPPWVYRALSPWVVPTFRKYAGRTTREVLEGLTSSVELRSFLSYIHFDYGSLPSYSSFAAHAVAQCYFFRGTAYPVGGPGQLAKAAAAVLHSHGARLCTRSPVSSLIIQDGRVVGVRVKGREVFARRAVVSAVGARRTFLTLVRPEDRRFVAAEVAALEGQGGVEGVGLGQAAAHFSLFFSFEGDGVALGLPLYNTFLMGGVDVDRAGGEWAGPGAEQRVEEVGREAGVEVGAVFITFASRKDTTAEERAPGIISGQVLAEGRWEWMAGKEEEGEGQGRGRGKGAVYEEMKERMRVLLMSKLLDAFPQLRQCRLLHSDLGTPLSSEEWLGAERGSSYGMAHSVERVEAEWLRCGVAGLKGLYLTGTDVTMAGLEGAVMGGALAAAAVDKRVLWRHLNRIVGARLWRKKAMEADGE